MDSLELSGLVYVDVIIAVTFLLFIVFGVIRGFTNDVLSLMTWLGAAFFTKALFPYAQPYARQIVSEPFFSDVILGFVIFIFSLILLVFIAKTISNVIRKSALSGLDRTFGIFSGSLRAMVLLVGAYFTALMFYKAGKTPPEFQQARLLGAVHIPAQMVHQYIIPKDLFPNRLVQHLYGETSVYKQKRDIQGLVDALSSPKPGHQNLDQSVNKRNATVIKGKPSQAVETKPTTSQKGFQKTDRVGLEKLIENVATE